MLKISYEKERKTDIAEAALTLARANYLMSDLPKTKSALKQAFEYGWKCGMKEVLWQAHHLQAKIYLEEKNYLLAKAELKKAKELLEAIVSNLSDEVKRPYLNRKEVKEFKKDLKAIKKPTKVSRKKPRKKTSVKMKKHSVKKENRKKGLKIKVRSQKRKIKRHGK